MHWRSRCFAFSIAGCLALTAGVVHLPAAEQTVTLVGVGDTPRSPHMQMQELQQVTPNDAVKLTGVNAMVGYRGGDNRIWINIDLPSIPAKSFIVSAVFKMYAVSKIGMPNGHRIDLCTILKHVDPDHLSWKSPVEGIDWTKPGADATKGETADRSPPVATARMGGGDYGTWLQWDVTSAIQAAVTDGKFNGFLVLDRDILPQRSDSGLVMFCLPNDTIAARRPVLTVKYSDHPEDRTPANSLFVPVKPPVPLRGFLVYREGELPYAGYRLTKFAMISSGAPWSNFSASDGRGMVGQWGGDVETRLLIRFDGLLKPNSQLARATLSLTCAPGGKLDQLELSRVMQPWNTANVSWQESTHGIGWQKAGGATQEIRLPTAVRAVNGLEEVDFDVTPWVDAWLRNPAANDGMLLRLRSGHATLDLPEDANNGHRPRLDLEFGAR